MSRSFSVSGVELGSFVIDWSSIEETKEILLAKATLFSGEMSLVLENSKSQFSTNKGSSLFKGRSYFNRPSVISIDGKVVFNGLLKDIRQDHQRKTAVFVMENFFSKPTEANVVLTSTSINPVAAMLSILNSAGMSQFVDRDSFLAAAAPSLAAGAVVNIAFAAGQNTTVLASIQQLSELASVSVFVRGELIRARAFKAYQGNEAGLRQEIQPSVVRSFRDLRTAYSNFVNRVVVKYGASSQFEKSDVESIGQTGITKTFEFDTATGQPIAVPDQTSARYFAETFLSRTSKIPQVIRVTTGREFVSAVIGDRHPVTAPNWGFNRFPFEIIETHRQIRNDEIELTLRSL